MKKLNLTLIVVLLITMAISYNLMAVDAHADDMLVTATVSGSCSNFAVPVDQDFTYDAGGDPVQSEGLEVTVDCSQGVAYDINVSADPLTNGADTLTFGIYQDISCAQAWDIVSGVGGDDSTGVHPMCIQIDGGQDVSEGNYSSTVSIELTVY